MFLLNMMHRFKHNDISQPKKHYIQIDSPAKSIAIFSVYINVKFVSKESSFVKYCLQKQVHGILYFWFNFVVVHLILVF